MFPNPYYAKAESAQRRERIRQEFVAINQGRDRRDRRARKRRFGGVAY